MKKTRIPEWKDVEGSKRISQQTMLKSITSLTQALVELITNVDDAYERFNSPNKKYRGNCAVFYDRGGETRPTTIKVSDRAAGMDSEKLYSVLKKHGDKVKKKIRDLPFQRYKIDGFIDIARQAHFNVGYNIDWVYRNFYARKLLKELRAYCIMYKRL